MPAMAQNRRRTTFLAELFNDCVSIRLPLECQHPGFFLSGQRTESRCA
jgi:hypothetical protein